MEEIALDKLLKSLNEVITKYDAIGDEIELGIPQFAAMGIWNKVDRQKGELSMLVNILAELRALVDE